MRFSHLFAGLVFLAAQLATNAHAGTWYVATTGKDTYTGTSAKPFRTVQKAVTRCVSGDTVSIGPGTYFENVVCQGKSITLTRTVANSGVDIYSKGIAAALTAKSSTVTINCVNIGGGSYSIDVTGSSVTATWSNIYGATSACVRLSSGSVQLNFCRVFGSPADGIRLHGGSLVASQCQIYGNGATGVNVMAGSATIQNSVVRSSPTGIVTSSTTAGSIVSNCTIVKNSAYGLRVLSGASAPNVYNCILWGNGNDLDGCTATYSCTKDGDAGTGNISSYPFFLNWTGNDFGLTWNSPCINRGSPSVAYASQLDLLGAARNNGSGVDMGAGEFDTTNPNLVPNPSFEEAAGTGGLPPHWTVPWPGSGAIVVDSTVSHSGTRSWRFASNGASRAYCGAQSDLIPVEPGRRYRLSICVRSASPGSIIRAGWTLYNVGGTIIEDSDFLACRPGFSQNWTRLAAIRSTPSTAAFVRIHFFGPDARGSAGQVWWDDADMRKLADEPLAYGVSNVATRAETIGFGGSDTNINWTNATSAMSAAAVDSTDNNVTYRSILASRSLEMRFPAFNADSDGFPLTPMLLEIMYKDVYTAETPYYASNLPFVFSTLQYDHLDPAYTRPDPYLFYRVAGIGGMNDGKWKRLQIPFARTDFQLLRAINGKYNLTITAKATALPVDYVTLRAITDTEYQTLVARQRDARGFFRATPVDRPSQQPAYVDPTVFIRDAMQPVYTTTRPAASEIVTAAAPRTVTVKSAWGLIEPVNIGVYSSSGATGINISVTDLVRQGGSEAIDSGNITLWKCVNDDQRLSTGSLRNDFAFVPTRLEPVTGSASVGSGTSQGFWLRLRLPSAAAGLPAGLYSGTVTVSRNAGVLATINLNVEVISAALAHSAHTNPVYWDPFSSVYSASLPKSFDMLRQAMLEPFIFTINTDTNWNSYSFGIGVARDSAGRPIFDSDGLPGFDATKFNAVLDRMVAEGVTTDSMHVWVGEVRATEVYNALPCADLNPQDKDLYYRLSDTTFASAFKKLIYAYKAAGQAHGITFIFHAIDEPWYVLRSRLVADRLLTLMHAAGVSTGCTYNEACDSSVSMTGSGFNVPGGRLPAITDLVDHKLWGWSSIDIGAEKHRQPGYHGSFGYYTTEIAHLENPVYNRFHHGLFAFATDATDVAAYAQSQMVGDPYNDLDPGPFDPFPFTGHDYLLAYPTWRGDILPAIGGIEAIREGVKDAGYIATLKALIAARPTDPVAVSAQAYLDALKARIGTAYYGSYASKADEMGFVGEILKAVSATGDATDYAAFTTVRNTVIDYIEQLSAN